MPHIKLPQHIITLALFLLGCIQVSPSLSAPASPAFATDNAPTAASQAPRLDEEQNFAIYAHVDTDVVSNFQGGIQTGTAVDSVAVLGATFAGDALGLTNSTFNLSTMAIYTGDANARYIGAITNPSNIEGSTTRVVLDTAFWQQNWLNHDGLGLSTRLGMFDLNSEFINTANAAQLLNSSFGMDPSMSENFSVSTFPKNGSGLVATLGNNADTNTAPLALKIGLIQGDVDTQTNPFSQGLLSIAEVQWRPMPDNAVKLGLWQKHGNDQPSVNGGYLSAESRFFTQDQQILDGFIRVSYANNTSTDPSDTAIKSYFGVGLNWQAPFAQRSDDIISLGLGSLQRSSNVDNSRHERFIEISYIVKLSERIYLQPDLQFIQNPSGYRPDSWVGILRLHIE